MTEATRTTTIATLITKLHAKAESESALLADELVQLLMGGARYPGFWSGEIVPPAGSHSGKEWHVIERFKTEGHARVWNESEARKSLLASLKTQTDGNLSDELFVVPDAGGGVATAIITEVKPETQDDYFAWETKIQRAQANFPGYRGICLQPPDSGQPGKWTTLLRFDSPESLEKWFDSEERQQLLAESEKFVESTRFQKMTSAFPGWFPVDQLTGKGPANWKTSMLVLMGLFPVVMLQMKFLAPLEQGWNPSVKAFVNLVIGIVITSNITTKIFVKSFGWWLLPAKDAPSSDQYKGLMIVGSLLVLEILGLWNLLPTPK